MHYQSNDWPVQGGIVSFNERGSELLGNAWAHFQSESDAWLRALAGQVTGLPGLGLNTQQQAQLEWLQREAAVGALYRATASLWWANMVKDGARWDFKDAILARLRDSIMLCGPDECWWFEYSMPGNIFFAYVGRASGFSEAEIRAGAVYAQQTDPENRFWLNNWYLLDQKSDEDAISLGFELYDLTFGGTVSEDQLRMNFKNLVKQYRHRLAQGNEPSEAYFTAYPIGPDGPAFPLEYFDGENVLGMFGW
jgi:hypothetical protein